MSKALSKLFQPIKVGDVWLKHRVVLAPLTRFRADENHVPLLPIVKEYYTQRASEPGTLLITEATFIHPRAGGYANVPGIWSDAQINAWKEIVDAVHAKGSHIYMQLWALGRTAQPSQLQSEDPSFPFVSASDIPLSDRSKDDPAPRALTVEEIKDYARYYAEAASNAVHKAGFDGVEIHGAHGYLVEQFLKESSNRRTDSYGGSVENRSRFALEVIDAVVKAVGPRKSAIRLSPWATIQDGSEQDPRVLYSYLVEEIKKAHPTLSYIHLVEPRVNGIYDVKSEDIEGKNNDFIHEIWSQSPGGNDTENGRRLITAGNFLRETAMELADTQGDLVAFGRRFIANPDLPYRLRENISLTPYNRATFYSTPGTLDPAGYTDYPFARRHEGEIVAHL
ncbi:NADH:flavin oxidoreductase/NADH oxidase [Marasmius fiardii PR-910]|nr:NADH:flavin oxidoreductase/NADH oxidase [Marasmius fiardii PR-910]